MCIVPGPERAPDTGSAREGETVDIAFAGAPPTADAWARSPCFGRWKVDGKGPAAMLRGGAFFHRTHNPQA